MNTHREQSRPPWGTRLLGAVVEPPRYRKRRVQRVLTTTLLITHTLGILGVIGFQWLLLPVDELVSGRYRTAALVVTPVVVGVTVVSGLAGLTVVVRRWLRWPDEGRPPTREEQELCLLVPLRLTLLTAALWLVGGGVTTAAYGVQDPAVLPVLVITTIACGAMACGLGYIVAEISLRPLTAIAFKAGAVRDRPIVGIRARVYGIWTVTVGLPVTGFVVLAFYAVSGDDLPVSRLAAILGFIGVGGLVVSVAATWLLVTAMIAPIRSVRWAMDELAGGRLDTRVDVFDATELGQLQRGFNDMAEMVDERQRLRDLFVLHVGSQVARAAELQEPHLGGDTTHVGVLFVDLVGSTTLAATRPALEVVEVLNAFFEVVVEQVEANGGFIDQFQGDAALAVFGAPAPLADPATAALAAARGLAAALVDQLPDCGTGIGVSYGEVVAGYVGSATRFEYTVIGDPVNEAARLCEMAKQHPARVLAAGPALGAATRAESGLWTTGHDVELRGRIERTTLAWPAGA